MKVSHCVNVKILNRRTDSCRSADAVIRSMFDEIVFLRAELIRKERDVKQLNRMLESWKDSHPDELEW